METLMDLPINQAALGKGHPYGAMSVNDTGYLLSDIGDRVGTRYCF
jgi:hypothetical protein